MGVNDTPALPAPPLFTTALPQARVRLMTLVLIRWLAIGGQLVAIFTVHFGLGYPLPIQYCLPIIAVSALLNVVVSLRAPSTRRLTQQATAAFLSFDLVQLTLLLAVTGGLENPFSVLLLAPVAIGAAALPMWGTLGVVALALAAATILGFKYLPLPWRVGEHFVLQHEYVWGIWVAHVLAIGFSAVYIRRIATEARHMSEALAATQGILTREHRLAALGGLAAAAAHELGTPLATIALVAKELVHEVPPDSPLAEDVALLMSQAQRCREILSRLSMRPEESDTHATRMPLRALLDEIIAPHRDFGIAVLTEVDVSTSPEPVIDRRPELLHGLGNIIENAVDFAKSRVLVGVRWDERDIWLTVSDDGPGFSPEIIDRLGEPYVTTRPAETNLRAALDDDLPQGMGLGFFIAKTMIERIGGRLRFENLGGAGGALVEARWPRVTPNPQRIAGEF
jgi:two-component system sensor histidine kinase RegB